MGEDGNDFWVIRIDKNGNEKWNYTYNFGINQKFRDAVMLNDNSFVITGDEFNSKKIILIKINSGGIELWNQTYTYSLSGEVRALENTNDGGFALIGSLEVILFDLDMWLIKTNSTGGELWNITFGNGGYESGYSIVGLSNNDLVLFGNSQSSDFWLIKTNSTGGEIWNETYPYTGTDLPSDLVKTSDGGFALFGTLNLNNVGLFKTYNNGDEQWNKTYGMGEGLSMVYLSDGGFALIGEKNNDYWFIRTDNNGNTN